jgi:predicted PurR-regulated permease PerM
LLDGMESSARETYPEELIRSSVVPLGLPRRGSLRIVSTILVGLAALVLLPFVPALVLAAWIADLGRPLVAKVTRFIGKAHAAALITTAIVLSAFIPLAAIMMLLLSSARDAYVAAASSPTWRAGLVALSTDHTGAAPHRLTAAGVLRSWGGESLGFATNVLGIAGDAVVQVCVLVTHAFLAFDRRIYGYVLVRLPIAPKQVERFAAVLKETGRGLLVGTALTCLVQGLVGGCVFSLIGVPRPFVLGAATFLAAFLPAVGTALVWGPVAVGLVLAGRSVAALVLVCLGVLVISSVDNLLRPWIAARAQFQLPPLLTLLAMFGGVSLIGGYGVFLGPLAVRLGVEALDLLREDASELHRKM